MLRYRILSVLVIVSLSLPLSPNCRASSAGVSIFELPVNARNLGMGKVYAGLNHENFGLLDGPALTSLYSNPFGELTYATAEFRGAHFGISYRELRYGELTERDFRGNPTGDTFRYRCRGITGLLNGSINNVRFGVKGRVLQKRTGVNYIGGSLSSSLTWEISPFILGAGFSNLITSEILEPGEGSGPWKRELTIGLGFNGDRFNLGMDLEAELHERGVEPNGIRLGAEWWLTNFAALRTGIVDQQRHTIGWGIRGKNVRINYALFHHSELPESHFVSFSWVFGD